MDNEIKSISENNKEAWVQTPSPAPSTCFWMNSPQFWLRRVNRLEGQKGYCRAGKELFISSYGPHFGEEPEITGTNGSGTILARMAVPKMV